MRNGHFIFGAATPEEHLSNLLFQAENVEGWLIAGQEDNALAKAKCLLESAHNLVSALQASDATKPEAVR